MIANPLNKTDLSQAQAGMYECAECRKLAEAIAACGLDCQEALIRLSQLDQFFRAILEQFSPAAWAQASG